MLKLKRWLSTLLVLAITAIPAMAGNNDAKTENENAANATSAEGSPGAPSPRPSPSVSVSTNSTMGDSNVMALLGVLVMKGVLAPGEANAIRNAAPTGQFQALVETLTRKGVLSAADLSSTANPAAQPSTAVAAPVVVTEAVSTSLASVETESSTQAAPTPAPAPTAPAVVAAIAPLRVLPVDPPKKDGLNAAFKMGPVKMTPYGFLKATGVYDSSNPNGDDMPFPGLFLSSTSILNTGPTKDPEFHLKARSSRIGANFEWPDISSKLTLTGRIEGDFEGNFSEVDNRDVSSIRSSMFSFRQAWVRLDYAASDKTDIYFEGGQDWTLFGSSALPNILETTALGYWYGDIYERSPQFQLGLVQKLGSSSRNFKLAPTFAIMMPSTGQIEKLGALALQGQIAQAEREGADSGRPEFEGRLALQFQVDKAPGVAPAQIFWSGFRSKRTSIVTNSAYAATQQTSGCIDAPALCSSYMDAFPNGFTTSSKMYGNQIGFQLPTRWFTLVASGYRGGDLRFFFGGQVNTFFTDVGGLNSAITFNPVDGVVDASGTPQLACTVPVATGGACPTGDVSVAPQRPIRAFGGFLNLGLPLSRWFNANPKGHNAGWQLYLDVGKDQVVHRDLTNANAEGVLPLLMGKMFAGTLYYKLNPFVTFGFEQSIYATRLEPGVNYSIAGQASNEWQDHRTEFGPIFTF